MKNPYLRLVITAGLLFLSGCLVNNNDKAGNAAVVGVKFQIKASAGEVLGKSSAPASDIIFTFMDNSGTEFTLTEARINVRDIELDLPEGTEDSDLKGLCEKDIPADDDINNDCEISGTHESIKFNGPFVVDLLTGASTPEIGRLEVPAGVYKRIDIRMDDVNPEDGILNPDDALTNATVILKGTFSYNGVDNRQFTYISKLNEDVRFEDSLGIEINSSLPSMTAYMNVRQWLTGVDIGGCLNDGDMQLDENGNLLIDDESARGKCAEAEGIIKNNMKNETELD